MDTIKEKDEIELMKVLRRGLYWDYDAKIFTVLDLSLLAHFILEKYERRK